jgi:hypothetical protein
LYGRSEVPSGDGMTQPGITHESAKQALSTVAHAPAITACPDGYAGCEGTPSG